MSTSTPDTEDSGRIERWVTRAIYRPERLYRVLFYVAVFGFLFGTLFPFYWLFVIAVTPRELLGTVGLTPQAFHWQSFVEVFEVVPFHMYVANSIMLAFGTTAIVLVVASLAGYVFGRLEFPGRRPLLLVVLAISYFPPAAFFVPLYRLFAGNISLFGISSPNVLNTPAALLPPFTALFMPLAIFILTTFYAQIPDGLEDAARIEGTTRLGALVRVIIPLSAPGVATVAVLTFIYVYNEFFFSFLMTTGEYTDWSPLVYGIRNYQTQYTQLYNLMGAASLIGVLPVAILVAFAQEKIVSGLTAGALKE
ncbi:carbohydrate ABC transporter permease [Halocatena pleomorpha]|uniref:Carbohydrate ABC transporter permease n=1 Tax=Halocatena pleomorpha TaxID=1785090 RepID=A0A3P3R2H5_9EURY|nr:carbohydrate ABC transporter permease [Halocatena pleomorpha]RRJ27676.1 carbohydrate ABC transporter permease [Halocatena pleomorpha]